MKKSLVFVAVLLMLLVSVAFAEGIDYSQMDYATLVSIKTAVEVELRNRPEASPFELSPGAYTVGIDIKPGRYYVAACVPHEYNASIYVYESKEIYSQRKSGNVLFGYSLKVGEKAECIDFVEGNYVTVSYSPVKFSIFEFGEDDYYKYTPPEGTYVPAGIYIVGEDISAGTYRVYPASIEKGYFWVYEDTSQKKELIDSLCIEVTENNSYETTRVVDGNMLEIEVDVIMMKQPALNFE